MVDYRRELTAKNSCIVFVVFISYSQELFLCFYKLLTRTVSVLFQFNMKLVQAQSSLDLETVKQIPRKMLPELFSERLPDKNQYTNHFTFRCSFFTDPEKCSMLFHGYRDEGVVQGKVEEHLNKHIKDLDTAKGNINHVHLIMVVLMDSLK